ncbi:unnamed protein product [Mytilus edulis]|uniref:Uncharacterized protein n=1 Tax=Mytilus edulis TaxID=6550 RepID=A0A8S3UQF2_MYTED|nr:unnamed protein product [Mytilus edulis]
MGKWGDHCPGGRLLSSDNDKGRRRANNAPPASDSYVESCIQDAFKNPPGTLRIPKNRSKNAIEETVSIEDHWQVIKKAFTTASETSGGLKNRKHKEWITPETLVKVEKWKNIKNILNNSKTRSAKQLASEEYTIANKDVRNSARRDKRAFVDKLTAEAEEAARANNIKALYDNIKLLTGKYQKGSRPVKSKEGKTLNTHEEQMKRWVEHFKNVLNQDPPVNKADIPPSEELLAVDCKRPSTEEIKKADIETSTQMLYELFGKIWEVEEDPLEWKEGHMVRL